MKCIKLLSCIVFISLVAAGCGTLQQKTAVPTFEATVIEAGNAFMVTPDSGSSEFQSSDRISVNTMDTRFMDEKDSEIKKEDLKPGDKVKITYDGVILESYPAQISAKSVQRIGKNLTIDAYLTIIDDIYQEDSGLNGEIKMIALDTTEWTAISDIEKEILLTRLKEIYQVDITQGTYDELVEQGLIDKDNLYFPNGIHIVISNMEFSDDKEKITYSIKKWRGGLGAVGADQVTAKYKKGSWEIKKKNMWIS